MPDVLPPSGFLRRPGWAKSVGTVLYTLQAQERVKSLVVTLNNRNLSTMFAQAFNANRTAIRRQVLATSLGWTTTKIAERLANPQRHTLTFISPRVRPTSLNIPVDIEVTGQLQFLNVRDPLIAAQMQVFSVRYPGESPFHSYLLPQALLELKARVSSRANTHIILDSRLHTKVYRDEVHEMLSEFEHVELASLIETVDNTSSEQDVFMTTLERILAEHGMSTYATYTDEEVRETLQTFWHTDTFRDTGLPQQKIVRSVLDRKDQLVVAATGGGKSLCFQLPAILLAESEAPNGKSQLPLVTLVFSPLISLMNNQIEDLRRKGVFSAIVLNSSISNIQRQEHLQGLKHGDYSIVYIAPEQIRSSGLRAALVEREIGLIALDEAHCLSQWGHDFRTDYFAVKDWITDICMKQKREFPILALTATARKGYAGEKDGTLPDKTSTVADITAKLGLDLKEGGVIITSPERAELEFRVEQIELPQQQCLCGEDIIFSSNKTTCAKCKRLHFVSKEKVDELKQEKLVQLLCDSSSSGLRNCWDRRQGERQRGIIYCAYALAIEPLVKKLRERCPKTLRIGTYYADMKEKRDGVLRQFMLDDEKKGLDIIVATNAFGMGIDVRRLGFVIHYDIPGTPEAYYQEAGRAGRDDLFKKGGEKAVCILLYHAIDLEKQRFLSRMNIVTKTQIEDVYEQLCRLRSGYTMLGQTTSVQAVADEEIIFLEEDIATRAGVSKDSIKTILYYLQYHTSLQGQPKPTAEAEQRPILIRGDLASNILKLKFEQEYQAQIAQLPENSPSQRLLACFLPTGAFRLCKERLTSLSLRDVAQYLNCSVAVIEREIRNLVQRKIITYACEGAIRWTKDAACAKETLTHVEIALQGILRKIDTNGKGKLSRGETAYDYPAALFSQQQLIEVSEAHLLRFLATLSHSTAHELRLFDHFAPAKRYAQPGKYDIRFYTECHRTLSSQTTAIFKTLKEAVAWLEMINVSNEQQSLDLLTAISNEKERRSRQRDLLLLGMLDIIDYTSDPVMGLAIRVTFNQPYVSGERIEVDLSSLRLKEKYEEHKLKLMERYATDKERRAELFKEYFSASAPIVSSAEQQIGPDLTSQQLDLIKLETGCHLIEGPAGCGKTTALIEYIKHLVTDKQVPMERILVTTHYKSARDRISHAIHELQGEDTGTSAATVNSFAEKIFKQYRHMLLRGDGLPYYSTAPSLTDQNKAKDVELSLIRRALKHICDGTWLQTPWPKDMILPVLENEYYQDDALERECLEVIKLFRDEGLFPTTTVAKADIALVIGKHRADIQGSLLYAVYMTFLQLMGEANYYTYEDQILFALTILRMHPTIMKEYQQFYEYVIVDELQDFTLAQSHLLLEICSLQRNVLVFGDRDQEIRPKEREGVHVFNEFALLESCGKENTHHFTTNFRSTRFIVLLIDWIRQEIYKRPRLFASSDQVQGVKPVLVRIEGTKELRNSGDTAKAVKNADNVSNIMEAVLAQTERIPEKERGTTALILSSKEMVIPIADYLGLHGHGFSLLEGQPLFQLHHVDRILVYFRLIFDATRDQDVERLLQYCVVPHLDDQQIKILRGEATHRTLLTVLRDKSSLEKANISFEQQKALHTHLAVIESFSGTSQVKDVVEAIKAIENGPMTRIAEQEQKMEDVRNALRNLNHQSVKEALAYVEQHISFLSIGAEKHTGLIITTVDYAKSQEFDTVFLIGADEPSKHKFPNTSYTHQLRQKRRLYVGMSRAKKRLYLVVNDENFAKHPILSTIPKHLYNEEVWSPSSSMEKTNKESSCSL